MRVAFPYNMQEVRNRQAYSSFLSSRTLPPHERRADGRRVSRGFLPRSALFIYMVYCTLFVPFRQEDTKISNGKIKKRRGNFCRSCRIVPAAEARRPRRVVPAAKVHRSRRVVPAAKVPAEKDAAAPALILFRLLFLPAFSLCPALCPAAALSSLCRFDLSVLRFILALPPQPFHTFCPAVALSLCCRSALFPPFARFRVLPFPLPSPAA